MPTNIYPQAITLRQIRENRALDEKELQEAVNQLKYKFLILQFSDFWGQASFLLFHLLLKCLRDQKDLITTL